MPVASNDERTATVGITQPQELERPIKDSERHMTLLEVSQLLGVEVNPVNDSDAGEIERAIATFAHSRTSIRSPGRRGPTVPNPAGRTSCWSRRATLRGRLEHGSRW